MFMRFFSCLTSIELIMKKRSKSQIENQRKRILYSAIRLYSVWAEMCIMGILQIYQFLMWCWAIIIEMTMFM